MKNLFKSMMTVAVAAMSFAACSTDITEDVAPSKEFTVQINAISNDTRTAFGESTLVGDQTVYPTLWEGTEKIKASLANGNNASSEEIKVSDDNTTASFNITLNTSNATAPFVIYAASPASAVMSGVNANYKSWNLEIPSSQTPTETSCDSAAQILVGQSDSYSALPSSADVPFSHMTAYAKINFINATLGTAKVNSISITADQNIAGRFYYYVAGNKVGTTEANSATKIITVTTSALNDVWVALAPTAVTALTFTINTDQGAITKEVTGLDKKFKSGVVSTFNVDMAGKAIVAPEVYTLVTDLADLAEGDNVIIAAAGYDYAMSTIWNTNNNAQTAITKSNNAITPTAAVQILTVYDAGTNLYKFSTGKDDNGNNKYIYAPGTGNHLRVTTTEADNCYWDITVSNTGVATMVAQTTDTRKNLRYNDYNGLFSCYASGQNDVALYYKSNGGTKIAVNEPQIIASDIINVTADGVTDKTADIVVRGIASVTATPDGNVVTAASVSGNVLTYTVKVNDGAAREGSITLKGGGVKVVIKVTQVAKPTDGANDGSSIEKAYTIEEAIALYNTLSAQEKLPSSDVWVKGTITGFYKNKAFVAGNESAEASNLAIGTAGNNMPVQLPSGSIRTALNLKDTPANLGKVVYIKGQINKYFTVAGLKSTSGYQFAE